MLVDSLEPVLDGFYVFYESDFLFYNLDNILMINIFEARVLLRYIIIHSIDIVNLWRQYILAS